jgi:SagB-type dehydrogenase family enzyme
MEPFYCGMLFILLLGIGTGGRPGEEPVGADSLPVAPHEKIKLPPPVYDGTISIEKALRERRSIRNYRNESARLSELSQLLWAAQGITGPGGRRTAPSAGALYPLEMYVVVGNVADLPTGAYVYIPERHELVKTADGDKRPELCKAALGQSPIRNAAAVLVISAFYERTTIKYGDRGIRYVHMEAGHAAQNVYLQAVALNVGTVVMGAFDDEGVKKVLHMKQREQPLYIIPVGRP